MIDMDYPKGIFDIWNAGRLDADIWEELGMTANHGFSTYICIDHPNDQKDKEVSIEEVEE